jgi:predicted RNA-binding Zn ribbon-like protein
MFDIRAHDTAPSAPGDLEVVQRFINLHEHAAGSDADLPPSREMVESFLHDRGLLEKGQRFTDADRETALRLQRALHARAAAGHGAAMTDEDVATLDAVARRARLHPRFGPGRPGLETDALGVSGALGRIVALVFLAELDGSWRHLKACAGEHCGSVFYDRSKNQSGRWCSMSRCGNRAKVRAWRERQRADDHA